MVRPLLYLYYNLLRVCSHCARQLWRRHENHSRQGFCSGIRTVISTRHSVRSNWNLEVFVQPRTQACSRYLSDQRRLGTERDSVLGEFSRQAWQVTSHPKSPRTTGNEAGVCFLVEEKKRSAWRKTSCSQKDNQQQTRPTFYVVHTGIWTQATHRWEASAVTTAPPLPCSASSPCYVLVWKAKHLCVCVFCTFPFRC